MPDALPASQPCKLFGHADSSKDRKEATYSSIKLDRKENKQENTNTHSKVAAHSVIARLPNLFNETLLNYTSQNETESVFL